MKPRVLSVLLVLGICVLPGCANSGLFIAANVTSVELSNPNYRVVATNVSGEARAGYLLGISAAVGLEMRTVALARIHGTGQLYRQALEDLWRNFERQHGSPANRRLALVNVRYDFEALNLLVYTRPTVSVRADVVEFGP